MIDQSFNIVQIMNESGVKAGTSGLRGKANALTDRVAYAYTIAFLQHLQSVENSSSDNKLFGVAGDLRPSTERIMNAVAKAALQFGYTPINCGRIPSPAVALWGIENNAPAAMVTASHNPSDQNGLKFTTASGEITKEDETGISSQTVSIPNEMFGEDGALIGRLDNFVENSSAKDSYLDRYRRFFPANCLEGLRIGVYQHTAVARDILVELFGSLGAEVLGLGRSDSFVAVDTEAITEQDHQQAQLWVREHSLDFVVSTDGDSDRPLVTDETGRYLRGDIAGILTARYLGADAVVTPVSCNSVVSQVGWFDKVYHDEVRIGSPYVIETMNVAKKNGAKVVAGYEGNGGFLLMGKVEKDGRYFMELPTRDAVTVHLSVILLAKELNKTVSQLLNMLPKKFTSSGRLKGFPRERAIPLIDGFGDAVRSGSDHILRTIFEPFFGNMDRVNITDGIRMSFGDNVVHLRSSRNADDFRCYSEAASPEKADELVKTALEKIMSPWETGPLPL